MLRIALALVASALLVLAPAAIAGQAGEDQYTIDGGGDTGTTGDGGVTAEDASGPLAGAPVLVDGNGDGVFGPGDTATIEGDISFEEGACITFFDNDGTLGTFCDNANAQFSIGSLIIEPTAAASDVSGGDGVLAESGLVVFATSGITVGGADDGALPRTGGEFAWLGAGLLALLGTGFALRRLTRSRSEQPQG